LAQPKALLNRLIVRKRKHTVYTFFIITVALVVLHTYTVTPLYQSTAKVLIEKGAFQSQIGNCKSYIS
jgi:uncharacterized protein involved in exopolysaccharide biosynthesis